MRLHDGLHCLSRTIFAQDKHRPNQPGSHLTMQSCRYGCDTFAPQLILTYENCNGGGYIWLLMKPPIAGTYVSVSAGHTEPTQEFLYLLIKIKQG